jgi:hypothetical protein
MNNASRRQLLAGTALLAAAGSGVTVMRGFSQVSASGQVDVQSSSAFQISGVRVIDEGNTSFTRVGDDGETLQVAIEVNNGDSFGIKIDLLNQSKQELSARITVVTPTAISVASATGGGNIDNPVQADAETFLVKVPSTESAEFDNTTITFDFDVSDVADPGSRDIGIGFEPLSTDGK